MIKTRELNYALRRAVNLLEHAIKSRPLRTHTATINFRELELCEIELPSERVALQSASIETVTVVKPAPLHRLATWCQLHGAQFAEGAEKGLLVVTYQPAAVAGAVG